MARNSQRGSRWDPKIWGLEERICTFFFWTWLLQLQAFVIGHLQLGWQCKSRKSKQGASQPMLRPQKHEESVQMLLPNLTSGFRRRCSVAFISPSAGSSSLPDARARTPVLLFNPSCHHAAETASELLKAHFYVEGLNPVPSKHLDDTQ